MTIPSPDEVDALLEPAYTEYRAIRERIAKLSLVAVLAVTRQHFPTAAFVEVDATDQDFSGALVTHEGGVLDADGSILTDDAAPDEEPWEDGVWNPLINLADADKVHWQPFIVEVDGEKDRLDLNAIERVVPWLMASEEHGVELRADGVYRIHDGCELCLMAPTEL